MVLRRGTLFVLFLLVAGLALGCGDDDGDGPGPQTDEFQAIIHEFNLGPLPPIPYPENNRFNLERISLGRLLFFDPILGGESAPWVKSAAGKDPYRFRANDMACATCHHPNFAFADARRLSAGVGGAQYRDTDLGPDRVIPAPSLVTQAAIGIVPRNAPSCLNTALYGTESTTPSAESAQFWDGRAAGLEEQATLPVTSRDEMAGDAYGDWGVLTADDVRDSVLNRVVAIPEYVERFKRAYAGEVSSKEQITYGHIARAMAAYQRELVTPDSRYDRFVTGQRDVFNNQEKEGFRLFFGKALCGDCHSGPMLSNFEFTCQGTADEYETLHLPNFNGKNDEGGDFGRAHAGPEFEDKKLLFRNPTIRNVEQTAPYFHSGNAGTLHEVMEFYNDPSAKPLGFSEEELVPHGAVRHESIRKLELSTGEIDAVVAFMRTTSAPVQFGPLGVGLTEVPERVPSGLLPPGIPTPPGAGPFYPPHPRRLQ